MSFTLEWVNEERRLIFWTVSEPWTWEELDAAWRQYCAMAESVTTPIHCVVDARLMRFVPKNTIQMGRDRYHVHPHNIGIMVVIGGPVMLKIALDVLRVMFPSEFGRYRFVETFAEAQQLVGSNPSNWLHFRQLHP
jgi:hypothetical protein